MPLDAVQPDDRLLVGPGEVVPVDGHTEDPAVLDESTIKGESKPVDRKPGERVTSGIVNAGPAFGMRATATAAQSTYAGIVRLAEEAAARKAPMVRLAAAAFVPFTLALAGLGWLVSGELLRAVAVLVVARPRALSSWPPRSRSSPGCPGPPVAGSWSATAPRWKPCCRRPQAAAAVHPDHRRRRREVCR